ncbi:FAD-dependent oxidoreductase [Actinobacteria bacterium YIM 96077]|uniref:FAD-dependent oxidoreductase n=1 Tax=Phytoactinopolyspora halophila TaxID=1981511 RepID=A0A329QTU8_9ACTN|nr:FAD-dependent oxidoreductase [Phytoactinopolyspora halophila]AYY14989.1 FAD-dependent oxidoreductase [Actinobacteria bacterium YIM 96077]RAW15446.1 FAD-dependent oxidoreductase [Phytoactinopolyspora halophila]
MRRVVVVGASLASVHAIEALRGHGYEGEIVLVGAEPHLPYDRPPLSKEALHHGPDLQRVLLREPGWYDEHGVELRLGRRATELKPGAQAVALDGDEDVEYDGLVIATGSTPRTIGAFEEVGPVHMLRTVEDSVAIHQRLVPGEHLVVLGAGFIGLEVAATAREMGVDVSVVELAPVPLTRVLGDEVGSWFRAYQEEHGVSLHCGKVLDGIEPGPRGSKIRLRDGTVLSADVVVAGVGVTPATGWLEGSGIELSDGVRCDKSLRTSLPRVVAAGDVVRWYNPLFDEEMRIEQWTNAVEQGRRAALTLLGADEAYAPVPYFWSDQFDAKMRFVGRSNAADRVHVEQTGDTSLVALFGRDGVLRGALCVNAARRLALYSKAIRDQVPWEDVVGT